MGHGHLHRRQHHHRQNDDPLSDLENGLSSMADAAATLFGIKSGGQGGGGAAAPTSVGLAAQSGNSNNNNGNDNNNGDNGPSTVYVTGTWTGTGAFSLSTIQPDSTTASPAPATTKSKDSTTLRKSTHHSSAAAAASSTSNTATAAATTAAAVTTSISSISSISSTTDASAAAATSGLATTSDQSVNTGLTSGAKAGIAIGVILGILALVAGAFALYRMKKNRDEEEFERANSSEKNPFSDTAAAQVPAHHGPVMGNMSSTPRTAYTAPATNPFGSGAVSMAPQDVSKAGVMHNTNGDMVMATGAATVAGVGAATVLGAAAANARRASVPAPLNLNRAQSPALIPPPPIAASPSGSNFSESSTMTTGAMAAVGGAGAGAPGGPRMHRVQMDFNPTMEDELQISAGQIVRIVREFDDGWCSAEIIQRDANGNVLRNQSGVCPRTCLSRLPLKPRQKRPGPPIATGPNSRGPPAIQSASGRVQSPALVPTPVQQRSMSPGPYGGGPQDRPQREEVRSRSNSANDISTRSKGAAIGPSPMNPASQATKEVDLPIQGSESPELLVAPLTPGHARTGSLGSSVSSFARKPVPKKTDA